MRRTALQGALLILILGLSSSNCSRSVPAVGAEPVGGANDIRLVVSNATAHRARIAVQYERGAQRRLGFIDGGAEGLFSFAWKSGLRVRLLAQIGGGPTRPTGFILIPRGGRLEMILVPNGRPLVRLIT